MEKFNKFMKISFILQFVLLALIFIPILYASKELYSIMEYYYAYGILYFVLLEYLPIVANLVFCALQYKDEEKNYKIWIIITFAIGVAGFLALLLYAVLNPPV